MKTSRFDALFELVQFHAGVAGGSAQDVLGEFDAWLDGQAAMRDWWFEEILPCLDYEIVGGSWEEPLWAWMEHPWFSALGLTVDECVVALSADGS